MTAQASIEQVREFAVKVGLTRWQLAKAAGLGIMTLRHMNDPDWSPTVNTLRKLEAYMANTPK